MQNVDEIEWQIFRRIMCAITFKQTAFGAKKIIFKFTNILPQTLPMCGELKLAKLMRNLTNLFATHQMSYAQKASQLVPTKKLGKMLVK